jgi:hypothetical protein
MKRTVERIVEKHVHAVRPKPKARSAFKAPKYKCVMDAANENRATEFIRERLWEQSNGIPWQPSRKK